jgi:hypothetical protein
MAMVGHKLNGFAVVHKTVENIKHHVISHKQPKKDDDKLVEISLTEGKWFSQLTREMCSGLSWDWRNQILKGLCRVLLLSLYLM